MKYVFDDIDTLITHIIQSYDYNELSHVKLQGALYLTYAYYTKYYYIVKNNERTPLKLFKANFEVTDEGLIVNEIEDIFKSERLYKRSVKRLLKNNIKQLYKVDERVLKNIDYIMMDLVEDLSDDELMERISSDYSYTDAKNNGGTIDLSDILREYNNKDEFKMVTDREVVDYNIIL